MESLLTSPTAWSYSAIIPLIILFLIVSLEFFSISINIQNIFLSLTKTDFCQWLKFPILCNICLS